MNKLILFFLLVILITYIGAAGDYISQCVNYLDDDSSKLVSENICNQQETSDRSKFICVMNDAHNNCEEIPSSECTNKFHPEPSTESPGTRRRVETESISDEDCYNLKTSDKYNYGCVANRNKDRCIEELIESDCTDTYYKRGQLTVTKEDCNQLETSDEKYKCVPSSDGTYCVQDGSNFINRFNLFLLTLCLLSLF